MSENLFVPRLSRRGHKTPSVAQAKPNAEEFLLDGPSDPDLYFSADLNTTQSTCNDIHPSRTMAISGTSDGSIRTWSISPRQDVKGYKISQIAEFPSHEKELSDIRFHPDGQRVMTTSHDGTIKIFSISDRGKVLKLRYTFRCHSPVLSCEFSKDGLLAVVSSFRYVSIFDIQAGLLYKEFTAHELNVNQCSWHPNDSKSLVTCGDDKYFRVWDISTKTFTTEKNLGNWVWTAKFLNRTPPRFLAAGCQDGTVKIFDERSTPNDIPYHTIQHKGAVRYIDVGRQHFYTCGASGCIRKNSLANMETVSIMRGHLGTVFQARADPFAEGSEETMGISSATDSTVKLWSFRSRPPSVSVE